MRSEGSGYDQETIDEFLREKVYAVVGVSPNREKYGYRVFRDLAEGGYTVYCVNPLYDDIEGERCYADISSLPEKPDVVEFVCPPEVTASVVREMARLGISKAWMQPGAESPEAIAFCEKHGIAVLHDVCVMVERRRKAGE
ncbi:MAG: CoA-binding protein [Actinobacteria bacterium]|nr:CoA-binding protein [Actinomycetota bacterium]